MKEQKKQQSKKGNKSNKAKRAIKQKEEEGNRKPDFVLMFGQYHTDLLLKIYEILEHKQQLFILGACYHNPLATYPNKLDVENIPSSCKLRLKYLH